MMLILKTSRGWKVYDSEGQYIAYETMFCNAMGHCLRLNCKFKVVKESM